MIGQVNLSGMQSSDASPSPTKGERDAKKLHKLCNDFESVFMAQMLKTMRSTVPESEFLNGGFSEEVFTGMLDEQFAVNLAKNDSSGPGKALYEQLIGKMKI